MTAPKEKSPNPDIDSAMKALLKDSKDEEMAPETLSARARVLGVAIQWEKVKYHIKDDEDFDPTGL